MTLALADAAARNRTRLARAATPHREEIDLAVQGLCKAYGDDPNVLDGIDLQVAHGQSVAIIGSNGTGKSTLLRCCLASAHARSSSPSSCVSSCLRSSCALACSHFQCFP